jgi:ubiquinone/menaquinone biosynthesis C-methylase UbiE
LSSDGQSLARARVCVVEAGLRKVSFKQSDVNQFGTDQSFDAAVGRFILEFVPEPVAVLRSLSRLVRPGESLLSMKCPTPLSLLFPRTYPCGRQLFPLSKKPCAAREQTRRWDPLFTESKTNLAGV